MPLFRVGSSLLEIEYELLSFPLWFHGLASGSRCARSRLRSGHFQSISRDVPNELPSKENISHRALLTDWQRTDGPARRTCWCYVGQLSVQEAHMGLNCQTRLMLIMLSALNFRQHGDAFIRDIQN